MWSDILQEPLLINSSRKLWKCVFMYFMKVLNEKKSHFLKELLDILQEDGLSNL